MRRTTEANIRYVGKGGGKKGGKGFQGNCYLCGEFGHSQWDCGKGKGKNYSKGYGKDSTYSKGFGKDGYYGKGFGKGPWYGAYGKGTGKDGGKGGMARACFGCGSTEHLLRDCLKRGGEIQRVRQEEPEEVMFIGNVRKEVDDWKHVPMKVTLGDFVKPGKSIIKPTKKDTIKNMFQVLQADEGDDENKGEVLYIGAVEDMVRGDGPRPKRGKSLMMPYTRKCHEKCECAGETAAQDGSHVCRNPNKEAMHERRDSRKLSPSGGGQLPRGSTSSIPGNCGRAAAADNPTILPHGESGAIPGNCRRAAAANHPKEVQP